MVTAEDFGVVLYDLGGGQCTPKRPVREVDNRAGTESLEYALLLL